MALIIRFLSIIYYVLFGTYKDHTVKELEHKESDLTEMVVKTIKGVQIIFYCKKKNYLILNNHRWIPNYEFSIYQLYSENNDIATDELKSTLKKVVFFPRLFPIFVKEQNRRKYLIEAYIDLLNADLYFQNT